MRSSRHFVIGDLQGCFASLEILLQQIDFHEGVDHISLLGDIVNRGPQSLACLRWAMQTPNVTSVLGNHDFHLLAVATGNERYHRQSDTITDILTAPDRNALLDWLRHQPLLQHLPQYQATLIHAGIPPQWTLHQAQEMANKVEKRLQSDDWQDFVHHDLYGNQPTQWHDKLSKIEKLRYTINSFARMRLCTSEGELEFKHKLDPSLAPVGFAPWYSYPRPDNSLGKIYFGHWSTIGLHQENNCACLDTGCLWGKKLSAICLDSQQLYQVNCPTYAQPGSIE